jgi:hypothetical protein
MSEPRVTIPSSATSGGTSAKSHPPGDESFRSWVKGSSTRTLISADADGHGDEHHQI